MKFLKNQELLFLNFKNKEQFLKSKTVLKQVLEPVHEL